MVNDLNPCREVVHQISLLPDHRQCTPLILKDTDNIHLQVGRPESPKRGRIASGKGDCDRVLVHGLERSCPGAAVPCRQQSSSFSVPNSVPFQRHGDTGDAADQHACIAKPSQRVQSAQGLHGSDGALSAAHNQQSVSFHGTDAESGSMTTSHKRMKACQRTHPSEATHMPLHAAPVGGEDGMQQTVDREQTRKNFNDMTLHGWVSAAPAEAKQCDAVRSRRWCVRGDSAQSCLSRQGHPASTNQQDSRIPQPPRAEYRSPMRPCADLTPLRMTPHSNLPVVRRREQEYAEELTLFEREFQELDSDPEVLAMIRKKRDVPKTVAPCPHGLSMGSVRSGCEPLRSNRFAAEPSKMVYGNGSAHVPHLHPRSSTGMRPENPVTRFGRKQVHMLETCTTILELNILGCPSHYVLILYLMCAGYVRCTRQVAGHGCARPRREHGGAQPHDKRSFLFTADNKLSCNCPADAAARGELGAPERETDVKSASQEAQPCRGPHPPMSPTYSKDRRLCTESKSKADGQAKPTKRTPHPQAA